MFSIESQDGTARTGTLKTAHGKIKTPFFMPVATKGAVKFADFCALEKIGTDCIISNSWLLYHKPGLEIITKAGGLHKFYNWKRGIFTDSGGFQTLDGFFKQKSTDDGTYLKSPYDGKTELITPEKAMEIQSALGSDVAMCLDDVPQHDDDRVTVTAKTARTHDWARRCKMHHDKINKKQLLFGIVQGGMSIPKRRTSAQVLRELDFDGYALGGLAIGEPISTMKRVIKATLPHLPEQKPRYLMGVGSPSDILQCIAQGVDCFDSTFPTQNSRHGTIFTLKGRLKLMNRTFKNDFSPIDKDCTCPTCKNHTRAYLHHLLNAGEPAGKMLATVHNLHFMQKLVEGARTAISEKKFTGYCRSVQKII